MRFANTSPFLTSPDIERPKAKEIFITNEINNCSHIVNTFLLIYQLGTCCVYVVFVATNITSILNLYLDEETDVRLVMLCLLLPLLLINSIRKLKYLAPFSTIANGVTMVSFAIILYYIFREPISFEGLEAVGELRNWPLFFGTVLFALEAIGVVSYL